MKKRLFIGKSKTKVVIVFLLLFLLTSLPVAFAVELNQTLTYDGNGNLINGDGKYRVYNEFNQLIKVYNGSNASIQGWMEEYVWHPTEDRILIKYVNTDYGENQGTDEVVIYVTEDFTRWYDLHGIIEINDTYYVRDDTGIVGEISFNGTDSDPNFDFVKRLFYHSDHLGSTSVITNSSGDLVEETFYEPFGAIIDGGNVSRFDYEGREFSELTGDYDFRFRKYNPELGVFTQPDALIPNLYDPQSLNRYRFERNNPYSYIDPDGKFGVLIIAGAISLIVAVSYGLEFYHGIREGRSFSSAYESGAIRSGQEVGGTLLFEPERGSKFLAGLVYSPLGYFITGLDIIKEISSGKKSSYSRDQPSNIYLTNSYNPYLTSTNSYTGYNQFSQSSSQIDVAQQSTVSSSSGKGISSSKGISNLNNQGSSSSSSSIGKAVTNTVNTISNVAKNIVNTVKNVIRRIFK